MTASRLSMRDTFRLYIKLMTHAGLTGLDRLSLSQGQFYSVEPRGLTIGQKQLPRYSVIPKNGIIFNVQFD